MECFMVKDGSGVTMKAARSEDADKIAKLSVGKEYKCKITFPRNGDHHKKFYVLMNLVHENLPERLTKSRMIQNHLGEMEEIAGLHNVNDLVIEIKILMHHVDKFFGVDGVIRFEPKSISFAAMDQDAFDGFYSRTIDIVLKHFLHGVNREDLIQEVLARFA